MINHRPCSYHLKSSIFDKAAELFSVSRMTAADDKSSVASKHAHSAATDDSRAERECSLHSFAVAVCAGLISGLTIGQAQYAFGTFVGALAEEFPLWTRVEINTALSVGMIVNALVSAVSGTLLDQFSIRVVVPLAAFVCCGGWICIAYTDSLLMLYLGFAFIYFSFPSNTMLQCGKLVGSWFPQSRGKVMGFVSAGNNTGGVLMILLSSRLAWRTAAFIFAGLQFGVALLYFFVVRDAPHHRRSLTTIQKVTPPAKSSEASKADDSGSATEEIAPAFSFMRIRFLNVSLALCLCFYTYPACLTQLYPALLADGVDANTAAGCLTLVGILGIASKVISGFLADKVGAKRAMQVSLAIQITSMGLLVIHGRLPADGRPLSLAWAAAAIYGLGFGAVGALIPLVTLEEYGVKVFGKASGIQGLSFLVPGMVAPAVAGACFDHTGQYTGAFASTAAIFLAAVVLLEFLCRTSSPLAPLPALAKTSGVASAVNGDDVSAVPLGTAAECDRTVISV